MVREKLASLLTQVAVALRGEPPPLVMWSWHDLPLLVKALKSRLDVPLCLAPHTPRELDKDPKADVCTRDANHVGAHAGLYYIWTL